MIQGFAFDAAKDGFYCMRTMSFTDIEYANSRNPDLFVTGILTFDESERDEIYEALNHPDWRDKIWFDDTIEDALIHPTKAKMDRILAVRDVLTIERIRGVMTKLINSGRRPLDKVVEVVNGRCNEIFMGRKRSEIVIALPDSIEDSEKKALQAKNDALEARLKQVEELLKSMTAAQVAPASTPVSAPEKKSPGRPPKKSD